MCWLCMNGLGWKRYLHSDGVMTYFDLRTCMVKEPIINRKQHRTVRGVSFYLLTYLAWLGQDPALPA
jgi:hypothetical protein